MRGDVRLQNGANKFEGRVEVCGTMNNESQTLIWKTVCNAGWDMNEAMVVCGQLGFSGNLNHMLELCLFAISSQFGRTSFQLSLKKMESLVVSICVILITS